MFLDKRIILKGFMITGLLGLIISCETESSSEFDEHLEQIEKKFTYFDKEGWQLDSLTILPFWKVYEISKVSGDTAFDGKFNYKGDNEYELFEYHVTYPEGDIVHYLQLDQNDTSYHFAKKMDGDSIKFFRGYYTYHYLQGNLRQGQLEFYWDHEDSLENVVGENLPDLPLDYRSDNY